MEEKKKKTRGRATAKKRPERTAKSKRRAVRLIAPHQAKGVHVFSQEIGQVICNAIKIGSWPEIAAEASGVSRDTLLKWLKLGNEYNQIRNGGDRELLKRVKRNAVYAQFVRDVQQAIAASEVLDLARIDKAGVHDWRALAWKLDKRQRERWGQPKDKTIRHEHSGPDGKPIQVGVVTIDLDKLNLPLETRKLLLEQIRLQEAEREGGATLEKSEIPDAEILSSENNADENAAGE